jgi:hypothetical protein
MGRKIMGAVPILAENLRPYVPDHLKIELKEKHIREGMKARYDKRHGARELPELHPGCIVWVPDLKKRCVVKGKLQESSKVDRVIKVLLDRVGQRDDVETSSSACPYKIIFRRRGMSYHMLY